MLTLYSIIVPFDQHIVLALHSITAPFDSFEIQSSLGANAPFSIIFSKVLKKTSHKFIDFFQHGLKIENDIMI